MGDKRTIRFTLNGRTVEADVQLQETLVDVLRSRFQVYSCRESCGQGLCGVCTALVDGTAVSGCLYLAVFADGKEVVTSEGLGTPEELHPVQEAFVNCSGFQCGFCTPGMVLMTTQLLKENPSPTEEEIKHYLSGNLCRCATYPDIIESVRAAAAQGNAAAPDQASKESTKS